jgi:hypothetical protein
MQFAVSPEVLARERERERERETLQRDTEGEREKQTPERKILEVPAAGLLLKDLSLEFLTFCVCWFVFRGFSLEKNGVSLLRITVCFFIV